MASGGLSLHPEQKVTEMLNIQLWEFLEGRKLSSYFYTRFFGPKIDYPFKKIFI